MSSEPMEDDDFAAKTSTFLSWLTEIGVRTNPKMELVDLSKEGRGRGVVAIAAFAEDEIVFTVPRASVLNLHTGLPAMGFHSAQLRAMPDWLALTALMISESLRNDSKWLPYLAILPTQLNSLVFWSHSELAELQASTVSKKIGKAKAEDMFSRYIPPLGMNTCDLETCHRVASIIMAYAFDIPELKEPDPADDSAAGEDGLVSDDGEDEKTILSMIPLADMLNADADRNNARICCDHEDLEMRTTKPIAKGDEIFNDYGQLPRSDLLRRYGYVTERYAAYDVAEISTDSIISLFQPEGKIQKSNLQRSLELSRKELERRVELADREGVYESSYDISHSGNDGSSIPDELLAFMFILLVDEENLAMISQDSLPSRSKFVTEAVGQVLVALLKLREDEYASTAEEDEELLQDGQLPIRKLCAIQVRLGEKYVLRAGIREAHSFTGSNKRMRCSPSSVEQGGTNKKRKQADVMGGKKMRKPN